MRTDILQQAQAIRASMDAAALEPWQAGTSYAKGTAFVHNGGSGYQSIVYIRIPAIQ